MIATLALAFSLGFGQGTKGLYNSLFPSPTGTNGFEDYALAMDLLDENYWAAYKEWGPPEGRAAALQQQLSFGRAMNGPQWMPDPKLIEVERQLEDLSMLQVRQKEKSDFDKPLNLIASGNDKPCILPGLLNGVNVSISSVVTSLANLERDASYVDASEGHTDEVIHRMAADLVLLDRTCRSTYVGGLIGTLEEMKVCSLFADNLDRFCVQDAKDIEELVNALLRQPPTFIDSYRAQIANSEADAARSIHQLKNGASEPTNDKTLASFNQVVNGMSSLDVDQMILRVQQSISDTGKTFLSRFSGPEEGWLPPDAEDDPAVEDPPVRNPSDVEAHYSKHWTLPEVSRPRRLVEALRVRAMFRLLRLHAMIIEFRWNQDRLPKSLGEINLPAGYDFDPLSNQKFVYEPNADGYRLYSKGAKQTGRIELGSTLGAAQSSRAINP